MCKVLMNIIKEWHKKKIMKNTESEYRNKDNLSKKNKNNCNT